MFTESFTAPLSTIAALNSQTGRSHHKYGTDTVSTSTLSPLTASKNKKAVQPQSRCIRTVLWAHLFVLLMEKTCQHSITLFAALLLLLCIYTSNVISMYKPQMIAAK